MSRTPVDKLTAMELALPLPLARQQLHTAQLYHLKRTAAHAKLYSPFYRQHLKHVDPDALSTIDDITTLPLLTPAMLTEAGENILALSQTAMRRVVTLQTSGSTGQPKRMYYTNTDLDATRRFFYHGMLSLITTQDRVMVLLPHQQENSVGRLLTEALSAQSIFCCGLWPVQPEEVAQKTAEYQISCLVGMPQHLLESAHHLSQGRQKRQPSVRSMLICSDYAPDSLRSRIHQLCKAETFLHWGSTETGLGGAVECALHEGCHLRESQILVEIINPQTKLAVPEGETGEIVITTIARRGMPLLRYRSGDYGSLTTRTCGCGGTTARLTKILGRNIRHPVGKGFVSSREIDDKLFALPEMIDFHAELANNEEYSSGELFIHYRSSQNSGLDDEILRLLRDIASIRAAEKAGTLKLTVQKANDLQLANHTFKRGISDNRSRQDTCVPFLKN